MAGTNWANKGSECGKSEREKGTDKRQSELIFFYRFFSVFSLYLTFALKLTIIHFYFYSRLST